MTNQPDQLREKIAKELADFDNLPFDQLQPEQTRFTQGKSRSVYLRH